MYYLETTSQSLSIKLAAAHATDKVKAVSVFRSTNNNVPQVTTAESNGTTDALIVAAPTAGFGYLVENIQLYNNDTIPHTVTVTFNNTTAFQQAQATLQPGQTLQYTSENGWQIFKATSLTDGKILIGNSSNQASEQSVSGDATLNNAGLLTIANGAVSLAKMADLANGKIIGRNTSGTGVPEALTTLPTAAMPALTGDVTNTAGNLATTIANNAVTNAKIADGVIDYAKLAAACTLSLQRKNAFINGGFQFQQRSGSLCLLTFTAWTAPISTDIGKFIQKSDGTIAGILVGYDIANKYLFVSVVAGTFNTTTYLITSSVLGGVATGACNGTPSAVSVGIYAATAQNNYFADRFYVKPSASYVTMSMDTTVPANLVTYQSLKLTGQTGVGTVDIAQRIEAANARQLRKSVTFSMWVYNNTGAAFTPTLFVSTPDTADNWTTVAPTVRNNGGAGDTVGPCLWTGGVATWTLVTWTADISGYQNIANGLEFRLQIPDGVLVASKYVNIAQAQLEQGSTITNFEYRSIGEELALCQRYCYGIHNTGTTVIGIASAISAVQGYCVVNLPQTMRTIPSITPAATPSQWLGSDGAGQTLTTLAAAGGMTTDTGYLSITCAAAGWTAQTALIVYTGTNGARLVFDAEL